MALVISASGWNQSGPSHECRVMAENEEDVENVGEEEPACEELDLEALAAERANQLRFFATVLTLKVLQECHALKGRTQETWMEQAKRLIEQTIAGVGDVEDIFLKSKMTGKMCRAVLGDLRNRFHRRNVLNASILLEDPGVEDALILSLRSHIKFGCVKKARNYIWAPAPTE